MSRPSPSSWPSLRKSASGHPRRGFSLIEVLVVIGLIAFLTAAMVAVIPRVANASKVAATRATIKKVDEMLNDRINGFRRWISKQDQAAGSGSPAYVDPSLLSQLNNNVPLAKIIAVKQLFQRNFPQTYSELPQSVQNANPRGASHQPVTDSAESLYLFLTQGPLFDTEPPSAADLKAIETADTDGDGIPEIVDGWGQPLRYYRWPTRLVRPSTSPPGSPGPIDEVPLIPPSPLSLAMIGAAPRPSVPVWTANMNYNVGAKIVSGTSSGTGYSVVYQCVTAGQASGSLPAAFSGTQVVGTTIAEGPSNPQLTWQVLLDPLSVDPDDPYGIATSQTTYISETPPSSSPLDPITPYTWSVPLIVSCGTDGNLGLFEPYDTTNFGNLAQPMPPPNGVTDATPFWRDAMYDNITNHQQ